MPRHLVSLLLRYGCAVVSIALAIGLRLLLDPLLGAQFTYATVLLAIFVTARYGGFGPTLAAVILGACAADFFLLPPRWSFGLIGSDQQVGMALYLLAGLGIAMLAESMHAAQLALREANLVLEKRVEERANELTSVNEKLWEADRRLALAFQQSRIGGWEVDLTNHTASRTLEHARIFGYESLVPDWSFERFLEHVLPDDRPRVHRQFQQAVALRTHMSLECRIRRADGEVRWIWATAVPSLDSEGRPRRMAGVVQDITERKLASEALRERERLLATVTASARVGLVVVGVGYRYLFANEAYAEIFGLGAREIVGRRVPDVLAEGWSQIQPRLDRALDGERVSYELSLPPIGGAQGTRHYTVVYEPRVGDDLERSVVVVVVDITPRKRAEEALQASEERLRLMIEAVSDHAIFMLDASGLILTWSRGAELIDGYTAEEIVGRHYSCLFTPESIASGLPQRELEQAAVEGRASVDGWRVRKNGSRFWANGTLAALYDGNHSVKGFSKITRDLTAKRQNDELLRSVLNHTLDAIVSIDERGTVSMINRAGEQLFGREASEVVGQNIGMLMLEPYRNQHHDSLANDMSAGDAKVIGVGREVQGLRKDGTTIPLDLAVTEFRLDDQRQYVWIMRDVSEKKALEARIRQSQKMEAFGQLAGGVAHDFNNLLAIIMGNLELLRSESSAAQELDLIDRALHATTRGAELTHRLLAYARKQELDPKRVNLNSLVRNMVDLLSRTIGEDVEIVTNLAPDVDGVEVDSGQLENALLNLAVNARDAMPKGGKLTISTRVMQLDADYAEQHPGTTPGDYEVVSVTDTGRGMTKDVLARVFEPFFTTKDVGKGTGLGLSMVYGFMKQSGGHATIYSEVGQGTTVSLYLPRAAGPGVVATEKAAQQQQQRLGLDRHILLVEDDPAVRSMVERQLSFLRYRIETAADGREALERIRLHDDIDLLLTDVVMPGGMSGVDLAMAARQVRPRLHVLFMSGYAEGGNAGERIRAEGMHCLGKPFTRAQLADAIMQAFDGKEVTDAS